MAMVRRKEKHGVFTCIDGPYDGKQIRLSIEGPYVASAYFSVGEWWPGRYVQDSEKRDHVKWEVKSGSTSGYRPG